MASNRCHDKKRTNRVERLIYRSARYRIILYYCVCCAIVFVLFPIVTYIYFYSGGTIFFIIAAALILLLQNYVFIGSALIVRRRLRNAGYQDASFQLARIVLTYFGAKALALRYPNSEDLRPIPVGPGGQTVLLLRMIGRTNVRREGAPFR